MTATEKAAFKAPTEAHWYLPTGAPFHRVPYADKKRKGELRDATLRDAKVVGAARSVTSIQKFVAKAALEAWSKNQLLEAIRREVQANGWPTAAGRPIEKPEHIEKWLAKIVAEASRVREEAAERGDKLHDALMRAARGLTIPRAFSKHVKAVQKALARHKIDITQGKSEMSFYSPEGYGGTVDWFEVGSEREDGNAKILDYKTRQLLDEKVRLAYPEKAQQLAAYRRAIELPDADCYNVFVDEQAHVCVHHWDEPTLRRETKKFLLLNEYVHVSDRYWPTSKGGPVIWERPTNYDE